MGCWRKRVKRVISVSNVALTGLRARQGHTSRQLDPRYTLACPSPAHVITRGRKGGILPISAMKLPPQFPSRPFLPPSLHDLPTLLPVFQVFLSLPCLVCLPLFQILQTVFLPFLFFLFPIRPYFPITSLLNLPLSFKPYRFSSSSCFFFKSRDTGYCPSVCLLIFLTASR